MNTAPPRRVSTPAGDPAWLVTGHDAVRTLLSDPRLGRSHPDPENASRYSNAVIFGRVTEPQTAEQEQTENTMMRRLLAKSFSARRLAYLRPRIEAMVAELLDAVEAAPRPVDLHEALAFPLPALVICELLGVPYEDRETFRRWSDDAGDMTDEARSMQGIGRLKDYMRGLLDAKRAAPNEDVLSDLVAAQAYSQGAFTDEHAVDLAAGLLFAGHETTVAAIDRGVLLLLENPEELQRLKANPELVTSAVEEILRSHDPAGKARQDPTGPEGAEEPATGLYRFAHAPLDLDGVTIPAGDMVLLDLGGANVDPVVFPDPDAFDVARESNPHMTFGHGPRFCLGAPLARMELTAVFGALVDRLPGLRLAVPVEELPRRDHLLTGGVAALPVDW